MPVGEPARHVEPKCGCGQAAGSLPGVASLLVGEREAIESPPDWQLDGGIIMRPGAFTAAGSARGKLRGVKVGSARGVISNKGLGITGRLCIWHYCSDVEQA